MKKIFTIFILLFAVVGELSEIYAQDTWVKKTDFPGGERERVVAFSIGTKVYIGTGYDGTYRKDFWEYDPLTNVWTQKADFGGPGVISAVAFSIGTKGYIGTGYSDTYRKDFWEYDPSTNVWTQKADFGGTARVGAVGFSIGTKGYIGTGGDNSSSGITKDFWEYDPSTNVWTQKADFGGTARCDAAGFSLGSKGYIGTGFDRISSSSCYKDFWEYDPSTNVWTQKADFGGTARADAVAFSIGTNGYFGTGTVADLSEKYKDFWEYDQLTNAWTQKADFGGTARNEAVGFSSGAKGYIGTGSDEGYTKDFWEYDYNTGTNELSNPLNISVFPNPSNGKFTITFPSTTRQIRISNSLGQVMQTKYVDNVKRAEFELTENGIYLITVKTDKQTLTRNLIICK